MLIQRGWLLLNIGQSSGYRFLSLLERSRGPIVKPLSKRRQVWMRTAISLLDRTATNHRLRTTRPVRPPVALYSSSFGSSIPEDRTTG